jgi:hypothetical protein
MEQPHDSQPTQEKKILVDEDWKAQVQAEQEKYERQSAAQETKAAQAGAAPLPPASLSTLITTLGMQAMIALGWMPDPATGKAEVQLDAARHFIDTLAMLQEKTEGNRTAEETAALDQLLHELRMGFVAVQQRPV